MWLPMSDLDLLHEACPGRQDMELIMRYFNWCLMIVLIVAGVSLVGAAATVCCEKTTSGLFCQDVPAEQCASDSRSVPSACSSVSYCKPGVCYDSNEGACVSNTPEIVCNANNGIWSATSPPQCSLGCCILGDQAAFVSLVRCKKLSGFLGLQTNFKKTIDNEVSCILEVQQQDKGACVYEFEFAKTCKFTTREECSLGVNGTDTKGSFFKNKLCSAEELGTSCGPTKNTICVPGKDQVYFVDTCGNPANVYDSSKQTDKDYWTNVKDVAESCNAGKANGNSPTCGNCNYLLGSVCRAATSETARPSMGATICADLNCKTTQNGKAYKHGESWCVFNDEGDTGNGINSVGSRFYKHICVNGDEVLEQCADFRQEECIEDEISTTLGTFSQAACRVNRWQDCTGQIDKLDCENRDRRDCFWKEGVKLAQYEQNETVTGTCLPLNPPGLKFWEGAETQGICAQGNNGCVVTYEKGLLNKEEKCIDNCECLLPLWEKEKSEICRALGDCGPNINWIGQRGYKPGYNVSITKVKSED